MATVNHEIKEAMKEKKIIIGSRTVIKGVKRGHINSVIYASNCPEETRKDLEYYSKSEFVAVKDFKGNSVQLGEICGKPFNVLLVGIKK
ncbi:MAG: 50S ribosomal protein L30e [Candidatus Aenigmarchaeota archaeon]|nr:50S ribosomal protein L30e [Candidatus Aenigmarchaeota archaeon]